MAMETLAESVLPQTSGNPLPSNFIPFKSNLQNLAIASMRDHNLAGQFSPMAENLFHFVEQE